MYYRLIIVTICLLCLLTVQAQQLLIAERSERWNSFDMQWSSPDSVEYTYDDEERLIFADTRVYEDHSWAYIQRLQHDYNTDGLQSYSTTLACSGNEWQIIDNSERISWEYNDQGLSILKLSEYRQSNSWEPDFREVLTYEEGTTYLDTLLAQTAEEGEWINVYRLSYDDYDAMGNPYIETQEVWADNEWVPSIRITRSYSATGQLSLETVESYIDNSWILAYQRTYIYSAEDYLESWVQESWNSETASFNPFYREVYTNDNRGNRINLFAQSWITDSASWRNLIRSSFTYNEDDQNTSVFTERWSSSLEKWGDFSRAFYYYGGRIFSDGDKELPISNLKVFPNPSTGQINVIFDIDKGLKGEVRLLSMNGQILVKKPVSIHKNEGNQLNISNFPPGIYVLQLRSGEDALQTLLVLE